MEYSEFEDYGDVSKSESEQETEACPNYYPGMLADMMYEMNEEIGTYFEDQLFLRC